MTTKEYLNQIGKLTFMIEAKFEELYRLQTLACRVTVATDGERVKSSPDPDRMADAVEKIIKCEEELNALIKRTVNQRSQIIKMIDALDNPNSHKILTLRYVQELTDKEIASKMNIAPSHVYKVQKTALIEFEEKYGDKYLKKIDTISREFEKLDSK
jgi:DNA-directed RNA polymerase specialized sigma24 family protein